jgi:uncharacterized membrane protein YcaP (DUF421 family)
MDSVFRALTIYLFLLFIFRIVGNRALAQITTFDFVLLLIIGAATRNALIGKDYSMIHAVLLIITLVGADALLSIWKENSPRIAKWVEGTAVILVENGEPLKEQMKQCRIGEPEIMAAARLLQGLESMEQIKFAVLERSGGISIIPKH